MEEYLPSLSPLMLRTLQSLLSIETTRMGGGKSDKDEKLLRDLEVASRKEEKVIENHVDFLQAEAVLPNGNVGLVTLEKTPSSYDFLVLFFYPEDFTFV